MLIAIEAIDAAGKATQSSRLVKYLNSGTGSESVLQAFPDYTTDTGKAILGLLKDEWWPSFATHEQAVGHKALRALVLQTMMTQNRYEKYNTLNHYKGHLMDHMVCDRYFASGLVYGKADGLDMNYLVEIHKGLPSADLWILIDITAEESVVRRPQRRDEYEERPGFMHVVRQNYLDLFNDPPLGGDWRVVNGMQPSDDVHNDIVKLIKEHL